MGCPMHTMEPEGPAFTGHHSPAFHKGRLHAYYLKGSDKGGMECMETRKTLPALKVPISRVDYCVYQS